MTPTRCSRPATLSELGADPLFEIGARGTTHTMLSALAPDEQHDEIAGARTTLEEAVGSAVTSFAYPYQHPGIVRPGDTRARRARAGYDRACRNTGGAADIGRERYRLARHMVYDWPADDLVRRVRDWLAAA